MYNNLKNININDNVKKNIRDMFVNDSEYDMEGGVYLSGYSMTPLSTYTYVSPFSPYAQMSPINSSNYPYYNGPFYPTPGTTPEKFWKSLKDPKYNKYKNKMDTIPTVSYQYTYPMSGSYQNLNADKNTQNIIVKELIDKMIKKWIIRDYPELLSYLKIDKNGAQLIDNLNNTTNVSDDNSIAMELKTKFIKDHFLTKKKVRRILKDYVNNNNTQWLKIPQNKSVVKKILAEELRNMIKNRIIKKNNTTTDSPL